MPFPYYNPYGLYQQPIDQTQVRQQMMQYQQPVQPTQPVQQFPMNQAQNSSDDRIFVQGEIGAIAYLTAPGATVTLWDTDSPTIFVKSNLNGMPTMQKYHYEPVEKEQPKPQMNMSNYVTRDEFERRIAELMKPKEVESNAEQSDE